MTTYLSVEDLLTLAADLRVGPVRDIGLLDAAAHRPLVELYGDQAYPDLDTKAAVLLESIVSNRALVDAVRATSRQGRTFALSGWEEEGSTVR